MHLDLRPSKSSELVQFQTCCQQALDSCEFTNTRCGVSEDGSLTWLYKGAVLEVVSTSSGLRVASLDAQHLLRDEEATVTSVCELPCQGRGPPRLVAALRGGFSEQGMVVVLDVASSLVVKAIEIPQQVTVVERVLTYGGANVPSWAFSEQLRQFYGIVAVGTEGGYIYLVDLALDWSPSPTLLLEGGQVSPCPLRLLDPREGDVRAARQQALHAGQHPALRLGIDEQTHSNDCFHFRGPDLTVRQSFNEDEVYVSCLKYIPQSGTLAIGYSFGGFHLWKLFNPVIEFASTVEAEDLPVAFFVYQEPENDPKNFAYLWVCRDDRLSEQKQESICSVSLYQLSYSRRTFYANYGNFFEELNMLVLRLEQHLTVEPYSNRSATTTTWSSQLLSAFIVTDPDHHHHSPPSAGITVGDSFDDGCQGPDLSLCVFVWEAQDSRPGSRNEVFLAVFDMNRWYHTQMPSRIKCVNIGGQEVCPFLAVYHMNDAVYKEGCHSLVDIQMKPGSLLRFVNHSPMPPEQHFYPSSLAFDTVCVMSNGIVTASILGVQRQVLGSLESSGPLCLLKPFDLYHRCVQTGLMARSSHSSSSSVLSVEEHQRMCLLTLALEQGQIRFITACIRSWADGDYIQQGCTLQFILSWAWSRVTAIKQQIDLTCQPLFDWSEAPVDQRMLQVLQSSLCCLGHLRTVLHTLLTQSSPVSTQGQVELEHRIRVVTLLHCHLKVTLWFIHSGLLPEHGDTGKSSPMHYVYPASELAQVFADRRRQMTQSPSVANRHEMILIDALVHSAGDALSQLWRNEEGTGMYPPSSLHAALSMYLLEGVEERTKSAIMLYLLFDLAAVAHGQQEEFAEKIPRFARTFDLPLGLVQQIHGFWLIDHMNFQEGLNQLCLRSGQDLGPWQHTCILRALMHQGEASAALRYLSMRNPPALTADDLKMRLTILIANRLVNQAVTFVRNSCGPGDQDLMLKHIFTQCQHQKLMNVLLKLPLTDKEEKCLQSYLSDNADSAAAELLVLHLLQRAQYVPAIRLNDRMKHRATMDLSSKVRERSKTRNNIVDGFRHSLPATQQYLISNPPAPAKIHTTRKIEVPRPRPLSTVVTQRAERRANCQSAMILAVMDKVAEAGKLLAEEEGLDEEGEEEEERGEEGVGVASRRSLMPTQKKKEAAVDREPVVVNKPGPFLCTPTTPRHLARHSLKGQVVFPAVKEMTTTTQALLSSAALASPLSPSANRRSQVFTADCLSLLQTPKIDHTPARVASPLHRSSNTTPHSILKVSRLPRSSPRARGVSKSPRGQPKRLGFSITTSASHSPPLPSTPTSLTPSSTPSPTTSAAEPKFFKAAVTATDQSKKTEERSASEVATPKQLRFAEPEIREISPLYVSPDSLARPPLRLSPDEEKTSHQDQDSSQQESFSGAAIPMSDEEITFNISRQVAMPVSDEDITFNVSRQAAMPVSDEDITFNVSRQAAMPVSDEDITFNVSRQAGELMETDNEGESSTLPVPTPSPAAVRTPQPLPVPPSPPSQELSVPEAEAEELVQSQSEQSISPDESPRSRMTRPSLYEKASELLSKPVSSLRDRSPLSVRTSIETETRSVRTTVQSETRSERRRLSPPQGSPSTSFSRSTVSLQESVSLSSVSQSSVRQSSVLTKETKRTSLFPGGLSERLEFRMASEEMVDSTQQTVNVVPEKDSQDNLMVVECERESEAVPAESAEAMETIEPAEDSILAEARQQANAAAPHDKVLVEELEPSDMVEVAADEDALDLEVQVPTPIQRTSRRSTPERSTQSVRTSTSRRTGLKIELGTEEKDQERSDEPTPPKLRRVSPAREKPPSEETEWPETMPPLLLEMSDDDNSNGNNLRPSPSSSLSGRGKGSSSPSRRTTGASVDSSPPSSRRSSDKSPPVSPLLRGRADKSPPGSRRSTRSMDRSPPVSPSRRSTRSADRSPPVSPSRRSTQSVDRSPPVSTSRRSTRSADRSPPVSPSRRSTRSVDRSPPVSPSRRSVKSVDLSPPISPSQRATKSLDRSPPVSPSLRSSRSVDRSPPVSPSRRSTRSVDRSPPPSPSQASSRREGERGKSVEKSLPTVKSSATEEPLTVEMESSSVEIMPPPVSPPRRSSRLRTPERSPGRKGTTPERTTTATTTKTSDSETQSSDSGAESRKPADSTDTMDVDDGLASRSPSRRSRRSKTPDVAKPPASKQETVTASSEQTGDAEESLSSSRRTRKDTDAPSSPSRRSTRRSKTPDLVAAPEPISPSRRRTKAAEKSASSSSVSPSRSVKGEGLAAKQTSPIPTETAASEKAIASPSPSRRSSRGRSKTPERSTVRVVTRLRGSADRSESVTEEVKDIATATEEVRTTRRQQRDASPRAAGSVSPPAQETGDAPSFQFAPPTPLSRVQTDSVFAAPSDISAFIFSPPITRATRSQRGSASSTSTTRSTRSRGKKESVSGLEDSVDTVPEVVDQSASEEQPETSVKKKAAAKSGRRTKARSVPSASPSDSPITLVSPGQPASNETQPSPAPAKGATQKAKSAGATRTRVLRKRKAKLW